MKLFNLIALVAVSSSAFALPVERRDLFGVSAVCVAAIKAQMDACVPSGKVTLDNLESACSTYNSLKCKAFFKTSISSITGCGGEAKEVIQSLEKSVKTTVANSLELKCAKDNNGNICPISKYVIENGNVAKDQNDQAWKDAVNATCGSKSCVEAFTDFSENIADTSGFSQAIVSGILGTVGFDTIPNSNPDLVKSTADIVKGNQCGSTGTNSTNNTNSNNGNNGTNNTNGNNGNNGTLTNVNNGSTVQNTSNQANNSNDDSSDATTIKGTLSLAVVFALFVLLL